MSADDTKFPYAGDIRFWALRSMAMQAYADLEVALFEFFAGLSDIQYATAAVIFYRVVSSGSRNAILEKVFIQKFGRKFTSFRNSLLKQLRVIDLERNEIVHWGAMHRHWRTPEGVNLNRLQLERPEWWEYNDHSKFWSCDEFSSFIKKNKFYMINIKYFTMLELRDGRMVVGLTEAQQRAWRDIFLQPIVYPPPADHPTSQS